MLAFAGTSRFQLLRQLGSGGMGVVFEAVDREHDSRCALKLLPRATPAALLRFKHEFRALQGLAHPNLVGLGELLEEGGNWFFTMELVDGVDLVTYLRGQDVGVEDTIVEQTTTGETAASEVSLGDGRVDEARALACLAQLGRGLAFLHAAGKVHRDVKPGNVLVSREGRVVLLDFGLVADLRAAVRSEGGVTEVSGTPAYMAPEQAVGGAVGPPADMYALGQVLYRALTGQTRWQHSPGRRPGDIVAGVPELLDRLCFDLLEPEPARRPSAIELLGRLGEAVDVEPARVFFGRQAELDGITAALARSRHEAVVLALSGPSGIGKSALLGESLARLQGAGARVLAGRCYEPEGIRFKAVDGVMDALGLVLEDERLALPAGAPLLARLFPALRRLHGFAGETAGDAHELRRGAEQAARELLASLAARGPLVIAVDDFHWTDADSVAFLRALVRGPDAPRLLLLLASRAPVAPLWGEPVSELAVGPLPAEDGEALARHAGAASDAAGIVSEAAGHPLFIAELARRPAVSGERPRLDELVARRIRAESEDARRLLELVAVAGVPIAQDVIGEAAGLSRAACQRAFAELRAGRLVRTSGLRGVDLVESYHDRVRETLVAGLGDRVAHHAALLEVLERRGGDDVEALVGHAEGAGQLHRAGRHAVRAGDLARSALAFERAAHFYERALAWLPGEETAGLRVRLAAALADAGLGGRAAREYERAAGESGEASLWARAAEQRLRSGELDAGTTAIAAVLARVGERLPEGRAQVVASLLWHRARLKLRGFAFRARAEHEVSPAELGRLDALWSAQSTLGAVDTLVGADLQVRHLLRALEAGEPFRVACALYSEAIYVSTGGPRREPAARALLAEADALAAQVDRPFATALGRFAAGLVAYESGDYPTARGELARAAAMFASRCTGASHEVALAQRFELDNCFYLGELAEMCRRVPGLLADAERRGDRYLAAEVQTGLHNVIWLCQDDVPGARAASARGIAGWSQRGFHLQHYYDGLARGHIALYAGDGPGAHGVVEEMWPRLARSLLLQVQAVKTEAWALRARAAVAAGEASVAERAIRALERDELPAAAGLAALARAGLASRRGQLGPAREDLRAAVAQLDRCGVGMYAAACRLWLGERSAAAWMHERGVREPERFARMLVPGF